MPYLDISAFWSDEDATDLDKLYGPSGIIEALSALGLDDVEVTVGED